MKSNIWPRLKRAKLYLIFTGVMFYTLPLLSMSIGMNPLGIKLYNAVPVLDCCVCLGTGYFFGRVGKRDPLFPAACVLLFLPCMFIFYGKSAWIYLPIIAAAAFVGQCFGASYQNKFGG